MGHILTPQETLNMFMALKFHFTQKKYNYLTYNGKIKPVSLQGRNDKGYYYRLSKKYSKEQMPDFIIANIIKGKTWVGEFLEDDAHDNYVDYLRRKQSLTYTISNDLDKLLKFATPQGLFKSKRGQYPELLQAHISGEISLETLSVLNVFFCFDKVFDKSIGEDDIIWSGVRLRMNKLLPFISYDKDKIKSLLKEKLLNT
jgi:hypothetical protein